MRTTKKEREQNARQFYSTFRNGVSKNAAIVIERAESSNPHISRCRFWAVPSVLGGMKPVVISESIRGIEGCFIEFLGTIKPGPQKTLYEDGFADWLKKTFGFEITYNDGLVIMLERD